MFCFVEKELELTRIWKLHHQEETEREREKGVNSNDY